MIRTVTVSDQNGTEALAGKLAALAKPGDVTLVQIYELAPIPVWHFDLYRLSDPEEIHELDIEDAFADGVSLIEWPDRLEYLTPENRLDIHIEPGSTIDARVFQLLPHGADWQKRIENLDEVAS